MIQCQNCGQVNGYESNFCRFCGMRMMIRQSGSGSEEMSAPPRPYVWKTDEYQVKESAARNTQQIRRVQPLANNPSVLPVPPVYAHPASAYHPRLSYNHRCLHCGTHHPPVIQKRISTQGWILFAILLFVFFPAFWVGLLVKERVAVCPVCNFRFS